MNKNTFEINDPWQIFVDWFEEAKSKNLPQYNAMMLATCDTNMQPSARMVLLKSYVGGKFVFFTNYNSRKALELNKNNKVALVFYWCKLDKQVRVEGEAKKVIKEESKKYFQQRERDSQIGAWASKQSARLVDFSELENRFNLYKNKFKAQGIIDYPEFWGGYSVVPTKMEFWEQQKNRLHHRCLYTNNNGCWQKELLYP